MDPKEKIEAAEHREDRKDSEEMPVWAADMMKKMDSMHERMDSFEKDRKDDCEMDSKKDSKKDSAEEEGKKERKEEEAAEREIKAAEKSGEKEEKADRKDESEETAHKAAEELEARKKEEDRKDAMHDKERDDKARADATLARENRELKGRLEAMEAQVSRLYKEPSFEDRNALAEVRARADSVYQAVTGRPASEPLPGESPIAYRKRMADGLRKFSEKFKNERVDSLTGSAFEIIESQIYADAQAAAKRPDVMPAGTLRSITRNDSGHVVTEYIGDPKAAWRPFMAGAAVEIALKEPRR